MKATELKIADLMIGDWVNFLVDVVRGETEHTPSVNEYQPMRIDSIYAFGGVESELGVTNDVSQLQPIPITAEILGKNGFVSMEINSGHTLLHNNIMIELRTGWPDENVAVWLDWDENNDGVYANYILPHPKFVHELQHICYIGRNIEI